MTTWTMSNQEMAKTLAVMFNPATLAAIRIHAEKSSTLLSDIGAESHTYEFDMLSAAIQGIQRLTKV